MKEIKNFDPKKAKSSQDEEEKSGIKITVTKRRESSASNKTSKNDSLQERSKPENKESSKEQPKESQPKKELLKKSEIQIPLLTDKQSVVLALPMKSLDEIPVPNIFEACLSLISDIDKVESFTSDMVNDSMILVDDIIRHLTEGKTWEQIEEYDKNNTFGSVTDHYSKRTFEVRFKKSPSKPKRFKDASPSEMSNIIDKELDDILRSPGVVQMKSSDLASNIETLEVNANAIKYVHQLEKAVSVFEDAQKTIEQSNPPRDNTYVNKLTNLVMTHISSGIYGTNFEIAMMNKRVAISNRILGIVRNTWNNYKKQVTHL